MAPRAGGPSRPQAKTAPAGLPDGRGLKVAVLRSSFNAAIVDGLLEGALAALAEMGTLRANVTVVEVPDGGVAADQQEAAVLAHCEQLRPSPHEIQHAVPGAEGAEKQGIE